MPYLKKFKSLNDKIVNSSLPQMLKKGQTNRVEEKTYSRSKIGFLERERHISL